MTLLADRESIGKKRIKYLKDNKINVVIRLRFSDYYEAVDAAAGKTYQQLYDKCCLQRKPVRNTVEQYIKRWRIECLFRHLKTNGFHLEELNLKSPAKSHLMMAIVCLAYAITIWATWKSQGHIRRISFDNATVFPAQSIFRKDWGFAKPFRMRYNRQMVGGLQEVVSAPNTLMLIIFNKTRIFIENNQQ